MDISVDTKITLSHYITLQHSTWPKTNWNSMILRQVLFIHSKFDRSPMPFRGGWSSTYYACIRWFFFITWFPYSIWALFRARHLKYVTNLPLTLTLNPCHYQVHTFVKKNQKTILDSNLQMMLFKLLFIYFYQWSTVHLLTS